MTVDHIKSKPTSISESSPEFQKQSSALPVLFGATLLIGTGGMYGLESIRALNSHSQTGTACYLRFSSSSEKRQRKDPFLLPQEQMASIRRFFSLNISDMARVLRVERPTVYSWLTGEASPRSANLERIGKIYSLAREWRSMSTKPIGAMLNTPYETNTTLLSLLSEDNIDETAVREMLEALNQALGRVPSRRGVAEIAKEHGINVRVRKLSKISADDQFSD